MHFLRKSELEITHGLRQRHAAVVVKFDPPSKSLIMDLGVVVAADDVEWAALPERIALIDPDGKRIARDRHLTRLVSVVTFDPCHLVADVRRELWPW